MKRKNTFYMLIIMILLAAAGMIVLTGCGGNAGSESAPAEDTVSNEAQSQDGVTSSDGNDVQNEPEIDISALGGPGGVDVDLTKLSSTMVYAVVNDMMTRPNEYLGKKIRMIGLMSTYYLEETDKTYYACLITDAAACCSQGIEFSTTDEYSVSDYPSDGSILTVVGTYDLYEENGYNYCILQDAILE